MFYKPSTKVDFHVAFYSLVESVQHFILYSSFDRCLGCFLLLVIMSRAVTNVGEQHIFLVGIL